MDLPGRFDRGGLARLLSEGGRLDAPTFLLRSLEQAPAAPADLHWRELCARLTIVPILGSHYHLFVRENVPLLLLAMAHVVRLGLSSCDRPAGRGASPNSSRESGFSTREDAKTPAVSDGGINGALEAVREL